MFIESHPEYAAKWARYLGVSLSGYYSWKDRKEQQQKEVDEYKKMIKTIFQESNGTYGVPSTDSGTNRPAIPDKSTTLTVSEV